MALDPDPEVRRRQIAAIKAQQRQLNKNRRLGKILLLSPRDLADLSVFRYEGQRGPTSIARTQQEWQMLAQDPAMGPQNLRGLRTGFQEIVRPLVQMQGIDPNSRIWISRLTPTTGEYQTRSGKVRLKGPLFYEGFEPKPKRAPPGSFPGPLNPRWTARHEIGHHVWFELPETTRNYLMQEIGHKFGYEGDQAVEFFADAYAHERNRGRYIKVPKGMSTWRQKRMFDAGWDKPPPGPKGTARRQIVAKALRDFRTSKIPQSLLQRELRKVEAGGHSELLTRMYGL